jgi:hypothetical protein
MCRGNVLSTESVKLDAAWITALKGDRVIVTPENFIDVFSIARAMIVPGH